MYPSRHDNHTWLDILVISNVLSVRPAAKHGWDDAIHDWRWKDKNLIPGPLSHFFFILSVLTCWCRWRLRNEEIFLQIFLLYGLCSSIQYSRTAFSAIVTIYQISLSLWYQYHFFNPNRISLTQQLKWSYLQGLNNSYSYLIVQDIGVGSEYDNPRNNAPK